MSHLREVKKEKVEDSCGCVFCDINLHPVRRESRGGYRHHIERTDKWVPCNRKP
jgi:hypothetical protein